MKEYEFIIPTQENNYRCALVEFEDDPLVLFHVTLQKNFCSIVEHGFRFGKELQSVTYAYNSTSCLIHRGQSVEEECTLFIVKFQTLDECFITKNILDIHVYNIDFQPQIIGYTVIPKDYVYC